VTRYPNPGKLTPFAVAGAQSLVGFQGWGLPMFVSQSGLPTSSESTQSSLGSARTGVFEGDTRIGKDPNNTPLQFRAAMAPSAC